MKVLILGIGQSNFLNQLYRGINKISDDFIFHLDGYYDLSKGTIINDNLPYSITTNFKLKGISKFNFLKTLCKFSFSRFFWQIILFELSQKSDFKSLINLIIDFTRAKYRTEKFLNPLQTDIVHFHFCLPETDLYGPEDWEQV